MNKALLLIILTGLTLTACQRQETSDDIDRKAVERWQAVIDGDYKKAYDYLAPSHRQLENINSYESRMATARLSIDWQEVEFVKKDCQELTCEVTINMTYVYKFPKRSMGETKGKTTIKENWIKSDNTWYLLPDEKKKL